MSKDISPLSRHQKPIKKVGNSTTLRGRSMNSRRHSTHKNKSCHRSTNVLCSFQAEAEDDLTAGRSMPSLSTSVNQRVWSGLIATASGELASVGMR